MPVLAPGIGGGPLRARPIRNTDIWSTVRPDGRHGGKSHGRPRLLNPEQEKIIEEDLNGTPRDSGFERGSWNARMLARRILDRFGVPYSRRSAIRLAHRLGFSVRKPRPAPYNSATPEEQREFIKKGRATAARWRAEGRTVVAVDAATLRDSPVSRRGIRRRGGRETVPVNYSKKSIHMVGALGDGTLELQFHDDLSAGSYIDLVDHLRRRYGKVGIIADNAGALTGSIAARRTPARSRERKRPAITALQITTPAALPSFTTILRRAMR